ncbi:putative transcription factor C2H2 family [Helianthus annuus]|nr:putative transcription factor C2H2 family [Helianthus annuus]
MPPVLGFGIFTSTTMAEVMNMPVDAVEGGSNLDRKDDGDVNGTGTGDVEDNGRGGHSPPPRRTSPFPPYKRSRRDDGGYEGRRGSPRGGFGYGDRREGLMSYKQFIQELEDDVLPSEAEQRYQEYKSEYISTQKRAYFDAHKGEDWLKDKYHPTNLLAVIERRNEAARKLAKEFMHDLQNGSLDLGSGVTASSANKSGRTSNPASEDESDLGGKKRRHGRISKETDSFSAAPKAHPISSDLRRIQADVEQAQALVKKLDFEKGIEDNTLSRADNERSHRDKSHSGSSGPVVFIRGSTSVKGLEGVELLDTLLTYLYRVHGLDYYGMSEKNEPKGFRHVRADSKNSDVKINGSEWEKKLDTRWQERLKGQDPLEIMTAKEKIDAAAAELLYPYVRKILDEKYGWKYGCGAKGCTKLFHAAYFSHKHLKLKHPELAIEVTSKVREDLYFQNYMNDEDAPGGVPIMQTSLPALDQAMYMEKLAYSIIKHNYPFSYVEHEGTRDLHKFLHRDVTPITRNTAKADVLRIYDREKTNLKEKLQKVTSRICLTIDLWSSITTDGYMVLTAHYIDDSWVLRKKILNFKVIPPPHSGELLAEYMVNFLGDWGIEKKVFTITVDNAKYNDVLVNCLNTHFRVNRVLLCDGDFTHVRCCAHVLNLIVQGGLKVIEGVIEKVRESVKYVRGSSDRKYKFAECIHHLSLQCGKKVRQDIVTRWNSTYLMLDSALAYRNAYARLALVDSRYKTFPSEQEWARVETITEFLKPFYNITTLFSGTSYPTSDLYFHNVWKIQKCIEDQIDNVDKVLSDMAKEMKKKFDKYWESYSMVLSFAVVLDPRYKFKLVEFCFKKLNMTEKERKAKIDIIFKGMQKLYDMEYGILSRKTSTAGSSNICVDTSDDLEGFESFTSEYRNVEKEKSQLEMYLKEPVLDRKEELDILQYWKENQRRYPQLSLMARDILSIPITTLASESPFSIGGTVLSKYRSSLLSSNVEALLCARDWLFDLKDDENENDIEEGLAEDIESLYPTYDDSHTKAGRMLQRRSEQWRCSF